MALNKTDTVTEMMQKAGIPLTRENYIRWAYFGTPPAELSAEEEAMLPPQFQKEKNSGNDGKEESNPTED